MTPLSWVMPRKGADRSFSHSAPAPRREPRPSGATAAPRSPCPSSSTPHTSCSRRTASHNTSTTSTGGAALTVGTLHWGLGRGQCSALLGTGMWQGWAQAESYRTALLAAAVSPWFVRSMVCADGVQCWGWVLSQGPPAHESLTPWERIGFVIIPSSPNRAKTTGHWSVPGDEHAFPVLVLLPPRSLQQENV